MAIVQTDSEPNLRSGEKVIFHKYGDRYFLAEVVIADLGDRITVIESNAEKHANREYREQISRPMLVVVLKAWVAEIKETPRAQDALYPPSDAFAVVGIRRPEPSREIPLFSCDHVQIIAANSNGASMMGHQASRTRLTPA